MWESSAGTYFFNAYISLMTRLGCEYCIETIIAPLKEHITETNFFGTKYTTVEQITQAMGECKTCIKQIQNL